MNNISELQPNAFHNLPFLEELPAGPCNTWKPPWKLIVVVSGAAGSGKLHKASVHDEKPKFTMWQCGLSCQGQYLDFDVEFARQQTL
ncbi:UNVERIFIED_CONTAM: hypothetical protein FKN15_033933 [Acipenser sinensis]